MTKEYRELLLKDLCTRLPYGVKVTWDGKHPLTVTPHIYCAIISEDNINKLPKILLRPMSSMTEDEKRELYHHYCKEVADSLNTSNLNWELKCCISNSFGTDWLNAHHFDYRGLIEKGFALQAPEGMYNVKKK